MAFISSNAPSIDRMRFYPITDEYIENASVVEVNSTKQIENNKYPYSNGTYDSHMGAQYRYYCSTCNLDLNECPGHHGRIKLNYPLVHPTYIKHIIKWIRLICVRCGRIIFDTSIKQLYGNMEQVIAENRSDRTSSILKYLSDKLKSREGKNELFCDHCNDIRTQVEQGIVVNSKFTIRHKQPIYKKYNEEQYSHFITVHPPQGKHEMDKILLSTDQLKILEMMSDDELVKLNIPVECHPRHFINRYFYVPPVNIRFINNTKYSSEGNNYITSNIESIINHNKEIPYGFSKYDQRYKSVDGNVKKGIHYRIEIFTRDFYKYIGIAEVADKSNSLYADMKGKYGIIRSSMMGKNISNCVFRAVIACDPNIPIGSCVIPRKFAKTFYIHEVVTPHNIHILQRFVANQSNYPGCNFIIRQDNGQKISNDGMYSIQPGDEVSRNVINGDEVLVNRSPTISTNSYTMLNAIVWSGFKDINVVLINPQVCKSYNADFDGDSITGKSYKKEYIREELSQLFNIDRFLLSFIDASPMIGQQQDIIVGCALLTFHDTVLSRYDTMYVLQGIPIKEKLTKSSYTGREIFSMVLPNIHYKAKSPMFKESILKIFGSYDESDYEIVIKEGKLISGIVCGSIVKESFGSLYHVIINQFGPNIGLTVAYYHQQMVGNFLKLKGFTFGFDDLRMGQESKDLINIIKSGMIREVNEFNNQIIAGNVVPPKGKTLKDYIDEKTQSIINPGNKFLSAILKTIDPRTNQLFLMVTSGSKGKPSNIVNMFAYIGQLRINGKRLENTLDYQRFSIHSRQCSLDPIDRGAVMSGYMDGYTSREMISCGMESRRNILTKGLSTAEAGALGKGIIRAIESCVVDNRLMTSRGYGMRVIEMSCCDDGFKCNTYQKNDVKLMLMSDTDIKSTYNHKNIDRSKLLIDERNEMLNIQKSRMAFNPNYSFGTVVYLPIDLDQILSRIKSEVNSDKMEDKLKLLDEYCNSMEYIRVNDIQRKLGTKLPYYMKTQFTMLRIAIRSFVTPVFLKSISLNALHLLLVEITQRIQNAFFEPGDAISIIMGQSYTAPMTQYLIDAHHASTSGGTSQHGLEMSKSTLNKKNVKDSKFNSMVIYLKKKYERDEKIVNKLINYITSKTLKSIIDSSIILYEGLNEHVQFPDDEKSVKDYIKTFAKQLTSDDLYHVKVRLDFRSKLMNEQSISIEDIANKLEYIYSNLVHVIDVSPSKGDVKSVLLMFDKKFSWTYSDTLLPYKKLTANINGNVYHKIRSFVDTLIDKLTISEFANIHSTKIMQSENYEIIKGVPTLYKYYYIETTGINMEDILLINLVDKSRTHCSNVIETYKYDGMMCGRQRIISELYNIFKDTIGYIPSNYVLLANVMMETGRPTALSHSGQHDREANDILVRMSYKIPGPPIIEGAINAIDLQMTSPSSDIMIGQAPRYVGTSHNKLIIDPEFMGRLESASTDDIMDFV